MILFEATSGETGCSYVRCYVWAENIQIAGEMARNAFENNKLIGIKPLFDSNFPSFCTKPSSEGWEI